MAARGVRSPTSTRRRACSGVLALAVAVTLAAAGCGSATSYSEDPKAYAGAAPAAGLAPLWPASAGADALATFASRFRQSDIGAVEVEVGGWGAAASPTNAVVLYAVIKGDPQVQEKIFDVEFAGVNRDADGAVGPTSKADQTTVQQQERAGLRVRVLTRTGPTTRMVTAVAAPTEDITIVVTSMVGNSDAVGAAIDALLRSGAASLRSASSMTSKGPISSSTTPAANGPATASGPATTASSPS